MTAPEFSRPHPVRAIHAAPEGLSIEADADERTALAERFGLVSLDELAADLAMQREEAGIMLRGAVRAAVQQACVVTGDPVASDIDETFALRFLPESDRPASDEEEIELDDADCDTVFYLGDSIDLGEAAAQTMALALDPFPRAPGADEAAREAGILSEEAAKPDGPLAALAKLKGDGDDTAS